MEVQPDKGLIFCKNLKMDERTKVRLLARHTTCITVSRAGIAVHSIGVRLKLEFPGAKEIFTLPAQGNYIVE